ncbi:MAG TPA: glycosyltransferase family 39 protein [Bacteroidales bacterium]|nr:glycosyltransferase family 39 protein [Bacteroidales bacterium]
MLNYFPKFFTNKAITLYFITLAGVTLVFFRNSMSILWMIFGAVAVVGFFYYVNVLTKKWSRLSPKIFEKRLFYNAIALRLAWVVFSYLFYLYMNGEPYEFGSADSQAYNYLAIKGATAFRNGNFNIPNIFDDLQVGDMGYPTYLSFVYLLTGNSIFIPRLLKVFWSAWTVILLYKLAVRTFGESTGRIAGILAMLMPNLIYYCGLHLKEVEMVFVTIAFLERADYAIRSNKIKFTQIFVVLVLAFILFTFRTVLGAVAIFAIISSVIFATKSVVKWHKRVLVGLWVLLAVVFFAGGQIATEVEETWENRNINQQQGMEWRAQREGGNIFAKYGSRTIFAPAIFIIPIPSMINIYGQENQQLLHGGNYVKNILAFFLILAFILILKEKKWRDFTLIEVYFFGYLMVIAFSNFAQSERFHLPALPIYLMFAAYGITNVTNNTKKYFNWYMPLLFFIILVWNYIKLAGRGIA